MALAGISVGFFVVLFDATALNVATGSIASAFSASVSAVQWVLSAYTVTFAAFMLTGGSLGDRFGARRCYLIGLGLFALASSACAAAPSSAALIAARAAQGAGAAAVVPCSLALIAARFPEGPARARALGIWGGVSGIGLAAGPVLGGALVGVFGWRAVFLVVVPCALVSMLVVRRELEESRSRSAARLDLGGQALAIVALVATAAGLTEVSRFGWANVHTTGLLSLAAITGLAFVAVERHVREPMVPPALLATRRLRGAVAIGLLFNFTLYGTLFCLALVLERALHRSSLATGLALLPLTVVVALGAYLSGRLTHRFGARTPMMIGLGGGLLGAALLAGFGQRTGPAGIAALGAVLGLVGVAMPAMTSVALQAAGPQRAGVGSALLNAARQAGGALGVALLGSVAVTARTSHSSAHLMPTLTTPMLVSTAGYAAALVLTMTTIRAAKT